eukprot:4751307-Amphidinium_carterae.1
MARETSQENSSKTSNNSAARNYEGFERKRSQTKQGSVLKRSTESKKEDIEEPQCASPQISCTPGCMRSSHVPSGAYVTCSALHGAPACPSLC